jgi:hypothetical protein
MYFVMVNSIKKGINRQKKGKNFAYQEIKFLLT